MTARTVESTVTFERPSRLGGDPLPAGRYRVLADEEIIPGLSFEAWHRTAMYLVVERLGCTQLRSITQATLDEAQALDRMLTVSGEAAPFPLEDVP